MTQLTSLQKGWGSIFTGSPVGLVFLASGADIAVMMMIAVRWVRSLVRFGLRFFVLDEFAGKSAFGGNCPPHHNLFRVGTWLFFKEKDTLKGQGLNSLLQERFSAS